MRLFRRAVISLLVLAVAGIISVPQAALAAYSQEQKITIAGAAAFDFLDKVAVTADGSRMIAGARGKNAAYVYLRSGTTWTLEQEIAGGDTVPGDDFGWSVAIDSTGTRVVVGAYKQALNDPGAVYVFSRSGTTWTQEQKLTASDSGAGINEYFGYSVAIADDGSRLVVGAKNGRDGALAATGSAYVFSRSGVTWTEEQKLLASDGVASDAFGSGVAIDSTGTRVAITAPIRNTYTGAAYVFSRSGVTWTEEQIVTASDGANYDEFGHEFSVGLDDAGTRMVVGAYGYTGGNYTGAAYVYSRSGVTWTEEQKLLASDTVAGGSFAISAAITGDGTKLAVGSNGLSSYTGAGYVFSRSGVTWTESEKITAADGVASDEFGTTTAIVDDGSRVLFAAQTDTGGNTNQGDIYIFLSGPAATPAVGGGSTSLCTGELRVTVADGSAVSSLHLDSGVLQPGALYPVACGTHTVSAVPSTSGMSVTVSGDCTSGGSFSVERGQSRSCTVTVSAPTPTPTPAPAETPTPTPTPSGGSSDLPEGSVISASPDPDLYIINASGFKRLFLNPVIFSFYGHLGGWNVVKTVSAAIRDSFPTSGLFRNCEANDQKVYAVEVTGEDTGTLHHINMTGDQAVSEDPAFFSKVFCINSNEFNWYTVSPVPYTALSQVPRYSR